MSKPRLVSDEDGRFVFESEGLEEIAGDVNALQSELKEIAEAIRTVNDSFRNLTDQMAEQNKVLAVIACGAVTGRVPMLSEEFKKTRSHLIKSLFG